ncbi:hypothetical protein [Chitinibacter sp. GC72]|uniref:hypothetical protein n=1 Tax=Chitinibacter sp. GC72 TaxID=1526917 RepID=UPI0012FC5A0E|nr:hypothetical protein [Chitinibacter sp. GC72]
MNFLKKIAGVSVAALSSAAAFAGAAPITDVNGLVAAVNFDDVKTGLLSVSAVILGVYLAIKAAEFILKKVKGA